MKKLVLYTIFGVTCFTVGFFAVNKIASPTDNIVYQEIIDNEVNKNYINKTDNLKIYINNVEVSNLSSDVALEKLNNKINLDDEIITINIGDEKYTATFEQLSLKYNYDNAIKKSQDLIDSNILSIDAEIIYDEEIIYNIVEELKAQCDIPLQNDEIKLEDDKFIVTTKNEGKILDIEKSMEEIKKALNNGEKTITLQLDTVTNEQMLLDINEYMTEIGNFTTKYNGSSNGRITNLKVAGNSLNGSYIYPGEIFSTNNNFAPYTTEKGYQNGSIILNGELVDGLGGGVCQVSSTLYNALLYAELDIIEKYNHSLKVGYIDYGFDAVLASTYKDLKFVNDTTKPVYIKTFVGDGIVSVAIYGEEIHDPNRIVKFTNEHVSSTAPQEPVIIENDDMYVGEEEVKVKPLYGQVYNVYKHIYNGEEYVEKQFVAKSVYKSRAEQRYVGTKEVEEVIENEYVENDLEEIQSEITPDNIEVVTDETVQNDSGIVNNENIQNNIENTEQDDETAQNYIDSTEQNDEIQLENITNDQTIQENNFNDEGLVVNNEEIQELIAENELENFEEAENSNNVSNN